MRRQIYRLILGAAVVLGFCVLVIAFLHFPVFLGIVGAVVVLWCLGAMIDEFF